MQHFSKKLNLKYYKLNGGVLFEDHVFYTRGEMKLLIDLTDLELQQIHEVKKIFQGRII